MKAEVFNAHNKFMIIKHALKENNVSQTCDLFGISRTTFYNWNKAYKKLGMIGLEVKEPKKPQMPNKVDKATEQEILAYVVKFPADGPKRIFYELKSEGITLGETGIYNVLKRNNLSTKTKRIEYSKKKIRFIKAQKKQKNLTTYSEEVCESYPGFMVIQRIDYMGRFDGIGKIYQYSVIDTFSKWGFVKLYNRKQDIDVWDYFEVKLIYLMKTFNLNIEHLITIKTKEFVSFFINNDKYNDILENFNINHQFVVPEKNAVLDELTTFNEHLVKTFYNNIGTDTNLDTFINVERAINKLVRQSNFSKVITDGCNKGKVPAEVVLERAARNQVDMDTLPLWLMALINSPKRGGQHEEK